MALLSADAAIELAVSLHSDHVRERRDLDVLRLYVTGKQRMPLVIPVDAPREVREMARIARINMIAIVVRALVESLYVDNFRSSLGDTAGTELLDAADLDALTGAGLPDEDNPLSEVWRVWQLNRFDRKQAGLYQAVFTYGYGYVVATPGTPVPVLRAVSPRRMIALYDDGADFPEYALERRRNGWRLVDSQGVYDLRKNDRDQWELLGDPAEHGLDYCPVVRYTPLDDLDLDDEPESQAYVAPDGSQCDLVAGEVAPLMTLQDQTDVTSFALKAAEWYSAFRQRWVIGWTPENRAEKVKSGASQLWTFDEDPDAMRIGEFAETTLDGYLRSREATLKYGATLSQTPVHELIGELVNLSAEALAAAEAGRDRKVMLAKTSLGEGHEQLAQVIGDYQGLDIPEDLETVWRDTSARAFGAIVDALGKLAAQLQIPPQMLWDRIPGVTRQDIQRWQQAAAEGDAMAQLTGMLDQQAAGAEDAAGGSGLILPPGARV
jgi:hypothetical protein